MNLITKSHTPEYIAAKSGEHITILAAYTEYDNGCDLGYTKADMQIVYGLKDGSVKSVAMVWDREKKTLALMDYPAPDWEKILLRDNTTTQHSAGFSKQVVDLIEDSMYEGII